jgi:hypothetical protein
LFTFSLFVWIGILVDWFVVLIVINTKFFVLFCDCWMIENEGMGCDNVTCRCLIGEFLIWRLILSVCFFDMRSLSWNWNVEMMLNENELIENDVDLFQDGNHKNLW